MDYSRLYKYRHKHDNGEDEQRVLPENGDVSQKTKKPAKLKYLLLIFIFSLLMILYVGNVVKVKSLLKEERKLEKQLEKVENQNQLLETDINRLESPERITDIATKKLGMIKQDTPPKVITVK